MADVIGYTVENPVRASLVTQSQDYPFWGSSRWTRDEVLEFLAGERVRRP